MSDIKFNCPACSQSLEAPTEMAGQLIDCPTCKKPIEIPLPPRQTPAIATRPVVRHAPATKPPAQRAVLRSQTPAAPSSAPAPSTRATSPGLIVAFVILALVCVGLAGGVLYLIKSRTATSGTAQGTPVAPTKVNVLLARQTAEKETLVEKVLPDVTVDGEVFIVTKGGQSIKLGLVEVALIPMQTLLPYLEMKHATLTNELATLEQDLKTAEQERDRLDKVRDAASQKWMSAMRDDYGTSYQAKDAYDKASEAASAASSKWMKLLDQHIELMSGSVYFGSMPAPLRVTKTNSDGRFRLLTPGSGSFAVAAIASRHVGDEVERYYWLIKIDPTAGASQTIMLSNDNLTSSGDVELLLMTK